MQSLNTIIKLSLLILSACSSSDRTSSEYKDIRKNKVYYIEAAQNDKHHNLLENKIKASLSAKGLKISNKEDYTPAEKELFIKIKFKIVENKSQAIDVSGGQQKYYSETKVTLETYEQNKDNVSQAFEESAKDFGDTQESAFSNAIDTVAEKINADIIGKLKEAY